MAVLKVIEILASSPVSWEDAAASAVKTAAKTVKEIRSVYVQDQSATGCEEQNHRVSCECKNHLRSHLK